MNTTATKEVQIIVHSKLDNDYVVLGPRAPQRTGAAYATIDGVRHTYSGHTGTGYGEFHLSVAADKLAYVQERVLMNGDVRWFKILNQDNDAEAAEISDYGFDPRMTDYEGSPPVYGGRGMPRLIKVCKTDERHAAKHIFGYVPAFAEFSRRLDNAVNNGHYVAVNQNLAHLDERVLATCPDKDALIKWLKKQYPAYQVEFVENSREVR